MFSEKIYPCHLCKKPFIKKYNLDRHIETCEELPILALTETSISIPINDEDIKCQHCSKLFTKKSKLLRHINNVKGECYKKQHGLTIINNNKIKKQIIYNQNITQNNIAIQPVINPTKPPVILAKHGEETISHITKEVMLELLKIESFPEMSTELMRLLYFNKDVPENQNWAIVYPKNKNAGVQFNSETQQFERISTYDVIDDKFSNMISLLFNLIQEIDKEDSIHNNLTKRQKANINLYCMHFGQLDISKTSKAVYNAIHDMAYNTRRSQMDTWKENGHNGKHLSLKF